MGSSAGFVAGVVAGVALLVGMAPWVFRVFDVRVARQRIGRHRVSERRIEPDTVDPPVPTSRRRPDLSRASMSTATTSTGTTSTGTTPIGTRSAETSWNVLVAHECRAAARRIASGLPAARALESTARNLASRSAAWAIVADRLDALATLDTAVLEALTVARPGERGPLEMIAAATVERHLAPAALEHIARTVEDADALTRDSGIAAAHAVHTARILSVLPLVVLGAGFVASESLRMSWSTPAVAGPILVGVVLNLLGRMAIARTVAHTLPRDRDEADSPERIADCLAASFAAGLTAASACARLDAGIGPRHDTVSVNGRTGGLRTAVAAAVRAGARLEVALAPLAAHGETAAIAETALSVATDGVAGADAAAHLAALARDTRRARTRSAIARLPGSLSVPVTMLSLPAFVIGAVVPVVAAGSGNLRPETPVVVTQG